MQIRMVDKPEVVTVTENTAMNFAVVTVSTVYDYMFLRAEEETTSKEETISD